MALCGAHAFANVTKNIELEGCIDDEHQFKSAKRSQSAW